MNIKKLLPTVINIWQKYQNIRNFLEKMEKVADFILKPGTILSILSLAVLSLQIIVQYPCWVILILTCIYLWVVFDASYLVGAMDLFAWIPVDNEYVLIEKTPITNTPVEQSRDDDEYEFIPPDNNLPTKRFVHEFMLLSLRVISHTRTHEHTNR